MSVHPPEGMILVFVYGSLKRGCEHHDELCGAEWCGEDSLSGYHLVLYEEQYPALMSASGGEGCVEGEVYRVSSEHLACLDVFEDCPQLYQRIAVSLDSGARAWAYVITNERGARYPKIEGPWTGRR